jgi:hypothetical protein
MLVLFVCEAVCSLIRVDYSLLAVVFCDLVRLEPLFKRLAQCGCDGAGRRAKNGNRRADWTLAKLGTASCANLGALRQAYIYSPRFHIIQT